MANTQNNGLILYKKAIDAFYDGTFTLFLSSLTDSEQKDLKYFLLSNNAKKNMPLINLLNKYEVKQRSNMDFYERIRKNTMQ